MIEEGRRKEAIAADMALIACAQKVEHYEISAYGTARTIASQLGETRLMTLLTHTLGEEEAADHLLTEVSKPMIQEATAAEMVPAGAH
jgi:Mn-containing catalase